MTDPDRSGDFDSTEKEGSEQRLLYVGTSSRFTLAVPLSPTTAVLFAICLCLVTTFLILLIYT